jgi:hypothetical protein
MPFARIPRPQEASLMRIAILLATVASTLGCNSSDPPGDSGKQHGPDVADTIPIDVELAEAEFPIVFHSWGGEWQGTEIDTELTLNADGTALLSHFGTGDDHVDATWSAKGNELMLYADFDKLVEMPGAVDWPKLQLRQADDRLYLFPTRESECLQYGQGTGWPLGEVKN